MSTLIRFRTVAKTRVKSLTYVGCDKYVLYGCGVFGIPCLRAALHWQFGIGDQSEKPAISFTLVFFSVCYFLRHVDSDRLGNLGCPFEARMCHADLNVHSTSPSFTDVYCEEARSSDSPCFPLLWSGWVQGELFELGLPRGESSRFIGHSEGARSNPTC